MAAPVTRLQHLKLPVLPASTTPENRFWRSFASPLTSTDYAAITHIQFSPLAPHDFTITSSTRVHVYSGSSRAISKTISRFKAVAYSGEQRADGKLIIAGDASGLIQLFNASSRAILRTITGHEQPVQVVRFSPAQLTGFMSCSDDTSVRLWDIPSQKEVSTWRGHQDYVRAGAFMPLSFSDAGVLVSGGYDGAVKLWDPRVPSRGGAESVVAFDHPEPVEAVLPLPSGTGLVTASGPIVTVFDLVAGRAVKLLRNHQKTVTSLSLASKGARVMTGGLDGHVKIFDTNEWKVVHGMKYPQPVLCAACSPDDRNLVVGMTTGVLSIRSRRTDRDERKEAVMEEKLKSSAYERRMRGAKYKGEKEEVIVEDDAKRKKLRKYEHHLNAARYGDALDSVLGGKADPVTVLTVFTALRHRSALRTALAHRDQQSLKPILVCCVKYLRDPRFVDMITDIVLHVVDLYAHALAQGPESKEIDILIARLRDRVDGEVEIAKEMTVARGMMGLLLAQGPGAD